MQVCEAAANSASFARENRFRFPPVRVKSRSWQAQTMALFSRRWSFPFARVDRTNREQADSRSSFIQERLLMPRCHLAGAKLRRSSNASTKRSELATPVIAASRNFYTSLEAQSKWKGFKDEQWCMWHTSKCKVSWIQCVIILKWK